MSRFKAGDKVIFCDRLCHQFNGAHYPVPGTVGTVEQVGCDECMVQWPKGSTSDCDKWLARDEQLKLQD